LALFAVYFGVAQGSEPIGVEPYEVSSLPGYSCMAVAKALPDHECVTLPEHAKIQQDCDEISKERGIICSTTFVEECKTATTFYNFQCKGGRKVFQWQGGPPQKMPQLKENGVVDDVAAIEGPCSATITNPTYSRSKALSVWRNNAIGHSHGAGRLDSNQGWSARQNQVGQWWQMDLVHSQQVAGVVTQGRTAHNQYVKSYKVQTSQDGRSWSYADGGKIFKANTAANNVKVENKFASPISARFVRIVVQSWHSHISMRAAALVCGGSWETKSGQYCSGNWGSDWGARTQKSLSDCQASCEASSSCTSITVGTHRGVANNCVLCTSDHQFGSAAWTTSYTHTPAMTTTGSPGSTRRRRVDWGKLPSARAANPAAVVSRLEGLSYADLAEIVTETNIRHRAQLLDAGSKGECLLNAVSSRASCKSDWGGQAFPYLCATHNSTYAKDDNAGEISFVHPAHYDHCGNDATACLVTVCMREDDASVTRVGATNGIILPQVTGFGNNQVHIHFSVTCKKRKKMMVCPLEKGTASIKKCTVKKECGSYSAPVPRTAYNGIAIYGKGIGATNRRGFTTRELTSTHKLIWTMVIGTPTMKAAFVSKCAEFCGFY